MKGLLTFKICDVKISFVLGLITIHLLQKVSQQGNLDKL